MEEGVVKWFSDFRGYGFIVRQTGEDAFVHHSDIMMDGYRSLIEGQRVTFTAIAGPKGWQARDVHVVA